MDIVRALAELERTPELHEGRLLVLLSEFAGPNGNGTIDGLTKLAKLDFLLRYPVMLERALQKKGRSPKAANVEPHERHSVESRMVRYRFGPWDHRYRMLLNMLIAKALASVSIHGRTISIALTPAGLAAARELVGSEQFADMAERAHTIRANFDMTATHLMKFIYDTFPELSDMQSNEAISP
jgi:hypothetical protein